MTELEKLQEVKEFIKQDRKERIRSITRAGCISFRTNQESYLVQAINELWDLVCDVALRKVDERILQKANEQKREADRILIGNNMSTKIEYIVGMHPYCFRSGEPAKILNSVLYSSDNLSNRPCLHVIFSDGVEDYIPISDLDNYRILQTEDKIGD